MEGLTFFSKGIGEQMKEGAMIDANKKSLAWRRNTAERGFCIASASTALAGRQRGLTDVARTIFPEKWCKMVRETIAF